MPRGLPHRWVQSHHLVDPAQRMQCGPRATQPPGIEAPVLRIPGGEPIRTFEGQLGTFVQLVPYTIVSKTADPLEILRSGAVLHATIGSPDAKHVFGGGRGCCADCAGWLVLHGALTLLPIRPY